MQTLGFTTRNYFLKQQQKTYHVCMCQNRKFPFCWFKKKIINVEINKSNFPIATCLLFSKPMRKLQIIARFILHILAVLLQNSISCISKRTAIFLLTNLCLKESRTMHKQKGTWCPEWCWWELVEIIQRTSVILNLTQVAADILEESQFHFCAWWNNLGPLQSCNLLLGCYVSFFSLDFENITIPYRSF